jgi:Zn-dependent protease with chaperone function
MIGLATGALMAAVWQGILLAAVVGLGLRLLPKTPAAVRFAIWFGVFLVVTALPLDLLWPRAAGAAAMGGKSAWLTIDARWSLAIAAVWAAASLVRAVTLVVAGFRVRALWKRALPVEVLHPTLRGKAAKDGAPARKETTTEILSFAQNDDTMFRRAELCVSDEVDRPTVIGFFAPKILVPSWLLEKLTPAELEQVVLHESGHLGRADDWMNLLQKIALVVFPLNPALAWVERRLCFERELAVDERVLSAFAGRAGAATAYAACLATVAEHRLGRRGFVLALGALGRESELGRRVGRILRRGEMMRPAHARLVLGGALLGLFGAAAGLEHCPQLVGFAANTQTVAQADVVNVDGPRFSRVAMRGLRQGMNVPHEVLMKASLGPVAETSKPQRDSILASAAKEVGVSVASEQQPTLSVAFEQQPTLRDETAKDGPPELKDGPAEFSPGGGRVQQWVVVAMWQSEDGASLSRTSRMVMTAATMQDPAARASQMQSDVDPAADAQPDQEQVHRYAAVPVRGGWLVFQL